MSCVHTFVPATAVQDYEVCTTCGTYHSLKAVAPKEIYDSGYWSEKWGHGTIDDQQFNVERHLEGGISKNDFALKLLGDIRRDAALEIACSPGNLLGRLSMDAGFARVVGVETDAFYEPNIRRNGAFEGELVWGYWPDCCAAIAGRFNLIIGLDVFEHSHDPIGFLEACYAKLGSGGQLILMMPLICPGVEMHQRMFHPVEHVYVHSWRNMLLMLSEAGFVSTSVNRWTIGHETVSARKP